jgi:hypothetical protein
VTEPGPDQENGRMPSLGERADDLVASLQRRLISRTARNMRAGMSGQVRRVLGGQQPSGEGVWNTATNEDPAAAQQPPECLWCPLCRAARALSRASQAAPEWHRRPSAAQFPAAPFSSGQPADSGEDPWSQASTGGRGQPSAGSGGVPVRAPEPPPTSGHAAGPGAAPHVLAARRGEPAKPPAGFSLPQLLTEAISDGIRLLDAVLSYRPSDPGGAPRPGTPAGARAVERPVADVGGAPDIAGEQPATNDAGEQQLGADIGGEQPGADIGGEQPGADIGGEQPGAGVAADRLGRAPAPGASGQPAPRSPTAGPAPGLGGANAELTDPRRTDEPDNRD